jgi:hypothetical protein
MIVSYDQRGEHDVAPIPMQRTISSLTRVAAQSTAKGGQTKKQESDCNPEQVNG